MTDAKPLDAWNAKNRVEVAKLARVRGRPGEEAEGLLKVIESARR